ncbi:MAG: sigma-70 family RNA polymerase sigma factor [Paracoccaceae bacterium]
MAPLDEIEAAIPALRRYAVALLRDRDAADDAVQGCLERAIAHRDRYRNEGSLRAWLFRVLLNVVRDDHRYARARAHLTIVADDRFPGPSQQGGQEAHMALVEVHDAMGRLPADQRAALVLVAVEGMRLAEAADALGVPEGTLVSRLGRARAALRQMTHRGAGSDLSAAPGLRKEPLA